MCRSGGRWGGSGNYKFGTTSAKLLPRGGAWGDLASDRSATLQDALGEGACTRRMNTRLLESVPKYPQTVRGTCEYSQLPKSSHIYSHNPAQTLNPHRTAKVKQRWSAVRDDERKAQGFVGGTLSLSLSGGRAPWTPRTKDGWVWRGGATMLQCSKSKCFAVVQMFCSSPNVLQ